MAVEPSPAGPSPGADKILTWRWSPAFGPLLGADRDPYGARRLVRAAGERQAVAVKRALGMGINDNAFLRDEPSRRAWKGHTCLRSGSCPSVRSTRSVEAGTSGRPRATSCRHPGANRRPSHEPRCIPTTTEGDHGPWRGHGTSCKRRQEERSGGALMYIRRE